MAQGQIGVWRKLRLGHSTGTGGIDRRSSRELSLEHPLKLYLASLINGANAYQLT